MPSKSKPLSRQKPNAKAAAARRIMEEAPLFAGLDDFVFVTTEKQQPVQKAVQKKKAVKKVEKKKKAQAAPKKPAAPAAVKQPESKPKGRPAAGNQKGAARPVKSPKPVLIGPDDILLSIRELCVLLKISRATLVRMDNAGKLPGRVMIGGSVRFHRKTIDEWIQQMLSGGSGA